jgi:hypothetical protein
MRASLKFQANTQLTLDALILTAEQLVVTPSLKQSGPGAVAALTLAAERLEDSTAKYRLGLTADGFAPPDHWKNYIDPNSAQPGVLGALSADLTVLFDRPWDRSAFKPALPQPQHIIINLAVARWGSLQLQFSGELAIGASGHPKGEITIKAHNWREILRLAVAAGALPDATAGSLEDGLGLIAQLAGNPEMLEIPMSFRSGQMFIGPVPLGPAPVLKLR